MPHHGTGPPPAMVDRAGTSTLDECAAGSVALTRARAS